MSPVHTCSGVGSKLLTRIDPLGAHGLTPLTKGHKTGPLLKMKEQAKQTLTDPDVQLLQPSLAPHPGIHCPSLAPGTTGRGQGRNGQWALCGAARLLRTHMTHGNDRQRRPGVARPPVQATYPVRTDEMFGWEATTQGSWQHRTAGNKSPEQSGASSASPLSFKRTTLPTRPTAIRSDLRL